MLFTTNKNTVKFNVLGYRRNKGEFNGHSYDNYVLTCAQAIDNSKGEGVQCFELTLPIGLIDVKSIYHKNCVAEFRYYRDAKRQKIDKISLC